MLGTQENLLDVDALLGRTMHEIQIIDNKC